MPTVADVSDPPQHAPAPGDLSPLKRTSLRAALTGSIFAMSVLAYLGDHDTSLTKAVVTVVGTGLVVAFGEAYAGLLSAGLASTRRLPAIEVRHELVASAMAALPGVLAGAFLLISELWGPSYQTRIDIALWLGVATLAACSALEAWSSHRSVPFRILSVVVSVAIGVVIIFLKAALH